MPNESSPQEARFHYSLIMEIANQEFFGFDKCSSGMASAYMNPRYFRERCLAITRKIKKRTLDVASADDELRGLLLGDIESLQRTLKATTRSNNDLEIIGDLLRLVAHLLGWEHMDGQFHRHPVYYQTSEQRDYSRRSLAKVSDQSHLFEAYHQRRVAITLHKEGLSDEQIALVISQSPLTVSRLRQNSLIDEHWERQRKL